MVSAWDRRRRAISAGLSGVKGVVCHPAEGAFYAFADIRGTGLDSMAFADRALQEAHVAVVPGVAFGDAGEGHVRLSFATGDDLLAAAVDRLTTLFGRR
jgi:aspartate/methionine/tyrosine aminotransferase